MNTYSGFNIQVDGQVVGKIQSFDVRNDRQLTPIYDPSNKWGEQVSYLPGRTTMSVKANINFTRECDQYFNGLNVGLLNKLGSSLLEALGEITDRVELSQQFIPGEVCWESFGVDDEHCNVEIVATFYEDTNYISSKRMDEFWERLENKMPANKEILNQEAP